MKSSWKTLPRAVHVWIPLLLVAAITALTLFGTGCRRYLQNHSVRTVAHAQEAFSIWKVQGVKGRILVVFGRYLPKEKFRLDDYMGFLAASDRSRLVTNDNLLFAAMEAGMVRLVYHVVPDDQWDAVREEMKTACCRFNGRNYRASLFHGLQVIVTRAQDMPLLTEKALILFYAADAAKYRPETIGAFGSTPDTGDSIVIVNSDAGGGSRI